MAGNIIKIKNVFNFISVDEFLDSEDYEEENEITETKWEKLKENICDIVSDSERKYYCW